MTYKVFFLYNIDKNKDKADNPSFRDGYWELVI